MNLSFYIKICLMISLSIALARLSHRPDANSKLAAAVMNRNWMDRSATCGGGDGCYYCETSGLWHSVWGLQQPQNCSQVSLLLLDAIKLSKWRIIWSVCIFFFLADFTMLQQEHKILRKQFSRFASANYCFLCLFIWRLFIRLKNVEKIWGTFEQPLSLDCSSEDWRQNKLLNSRPSLWLPP